MRLFVRSALMPGESIWGYLIRLAGLNALETPRWLLTHAGITRQTRSLADRQRLERLAAFTGVPASLLQEIAYPAIEQPNRARMVMLPSGVVIPRTGLRPLTQLACPACLAEDESHVPWIWDLTFSTVCPRHRLTMLTRCAGCGGRIGWHRRHVAFCLCGRDFSVQETLPANRYLVAFVGLLQAKSAGATPPQLGRSFPEELHHMDLERLLGLTTLLGSGLRWRGHQTTDDSGDPASQRQRIVETAATILGDWPDPFLHALEVNGQPPWARAHWVTGLEFMRQALNTHADRGRLTGLIVGRTTARASGDVLSGSAAVRALGLGSPRRVAALLDAGVVIGGRHTAGRMTVATLASISVTAAARRRRRSLGLTDAAATLGLKSHELRALLAARTIRAWMGPGSLAGGRWLIDRTEIKRVLDLAMSGVPRVAKPAVNHVTFSATTERGWRSTGPTAVELAKAILNGTVRATVRIVGKTGFRALSFLHSDIVRVAHNASQHRRSGYVPLSVLGRKYGLSTKTLAAACSSNVLPHMRGTSQYRPRIYVREQDLLTFLNSYVLLPELAQRLGQGSAAVLAMLKRAKLDAITLTSGLSTTRLLFPRREAELALGLMDAESAPV